jgi:hypothetical protein
MEEKWSLCTVVKMLTGLRNAWAIDELREDPPGYGAAEKRLFAHERLEAYQVSLNFIGWFQGQPAGANLSSRLFFRSGELEQGPRDCGVELLGRTALMLCALGSAAHQGR